MPVCGRMVLVPLPRSMNSQALLIGDIVDRRNELAIG